MVVCIYSVL